MTLVTGSAGFIDFHVAKRLLERGERVLGVDNVNDYYDVRLKEARLAQLTPFDTFRFLKLDVADRDGMSALFETHPLRRVIHLAAQAGVRYSLVNPYAYVNSNIVGFLNILEGCRQRKIEHLVYASSSSVYGGNTRMPFSVADNVDHPVSLYAVSKKANELMAHSYAHLYHIPCTGLRFFTVYGPWGRPDMALFRFTEGILAGRPIPVFNRGEMVRDFTYGDDLVEGVIRVMGKPAAPAAGWSGDRPDPATSYAPWRIFNIGNNQPVKLMRYIEVLEQCLGRKAQLDLLPMQAGDVPATFADVDELHESVGYKPQTPIEVGVRRFAEWYQAFYRKSA